MISSRIQLPHLKSILVVVGKTVCFFQVRRTYINSPICRGRDKIAIIVSIAYNKKQPDKVTIFYRQSLLLSETSLLYYKSSQSVNFNFNFTSGFNFNFNSDSFFNVYTYRGACQYSVLCNVFKSNEKLHIQP